MSCERRALLKIAHTNLCTGCLQLYLEALPEDKSQWINKTKELRAQYEKIKETVRGPLCGHFPHSDDKQSDIQIAEVSFLFADLNNLLSCFSRYVRILFIF